MFSHTLAKMQPSLTHRSLQAVWGFLFLPLLVCLHYTINLASDPGFSPTLPPHLPYTKTPGLGFGAYSGLRKLSVGDGRGGLSPAPDVTILLLRAQPPPN